MLYAERMHRGFQFALDPDLLDALAGLPSVVKPIGKEAPVLDCAHWMAYENHTKSDSPHHQDVKPGSIEVTVNTYTHFPGAVSRIVSEMRRLWPDVDWRPHGFAFMRTIGHVHPHRGGTRSVSLNIGLFNTRMGLTEIATGDKFSNYDPNSKQLDAYLAEDGDVYLLDVSRLHSVQAVNSFVHRYQVTYMCGLSYHELRMKMKNGYTANRNR